MRARFFVLLCAFAALIALTWRSPIAPVSTTVFAQRQGERQPAAQGQPTTGQGAAQRGRMNTPTFAGPRQECSRCPSICLPRKTSIRTRHFGRPALLPLQYSAAANRDLDLAPNWRESAHIGFVGRLQHRLSASKIVSPYPYKTAKEHYEALMAAAKAKGGPTVYTKATTPDWDGYYARDTRPIMARSGSGGPSTRPPRFCPYSLRSIKSAWCR